MKTMVGKIWHVIDITREAAENLLKPHGIVLGQYEKLLLEGGRFDNCMVSEDSYNKALEKQRKYFSWDLVP